MANTKTKVTKKEKTQSLVEKVSKKVTESKIKSVKELKKDYLKTKMNILMGKEKNLKKASYIRKEIARLLTQESIKKGENEK